MLTCKILQSRLYPSISGIACPLQLGDVNSEEVGEGFHLWEVVKRRESLGGYKLCMGNKL